jgi:hypothetical protein
MRLLRVLLIVLVLSVTASATVTGQVAPVQPVASPVAASWAGAGWIAIWPERVAVSEEKLGGVRAVIAATTNFFCAISDTSSEGFVEEFERSGAQWSDASAGESMSNLIDALVYPDTASGSTLNIAVDEGGAPLQFIADDHAWVLLFGESGEGEITSFLELWRTSEGSGVYFACFGPSVDEFNEVFDEFRDIRTGISFPGSTFDPAGDPFADHLNPGATPTAANRRGELQ